MFVQSPGVHRGCTSKICVRSFIFQPIYGQTQYCHVKQLQLNTNDVVSYTCTKTAQLAAEKREPTEGVIGLISPILRSDPLSFFRYSQGGSQTVQFQTFFQISAKCIKFLMTLLLAVY